MVVEPIPNEPVALATTNGTRLLVLADYHAGIEAVLSADGIEITSQAASRRERVHERIVGHEIDRVVILGDLLHAIGDPWDAERRELEQLFAQLTVPVTVVKGNHDGDIESVLAEIDHEITVAPTSGVRIGDLGFVHGHTWPDSELFEAKSICLGHEHPVVRLEDAVGGSRQEPVWLRGRVDPAGFQDEYDTHLPTDSELIVFPAFNEQSGGTWINIDSQQFLSPFLPDGLNEGEAYLLDGTRLGAYQSI